jgi:hypothetical protein
MILYARYEPTTDKVILQHNPKAARRKKDVVLYKDKTCTERYCYYSWYQKHPTPRTKHVSLNYARHELTWLPELSNR